MEVRPRYKQTEVGLIPEDWKILPLSDHFRIYAGGDVPKHSLSTTRSESHPRPIFANALKDRGLYGFTSERRSKRDSLTITARGYLGHAEFRDEEFFPIVRLLVLEPTGQLDARFTTFAVNDRVKFAFESTGVPQLTAPQVGQYSIAAPSLPEQRAIATALSDVDALLDGLAQLIAKKRDLKQATMQQLLTGQTRLPGFCGEWEVTLLGDIADSSQRWSFTGGPFGSNLKSSDYTEDGVRIIQLQNIGDGIFLDDYKIFTSLAKADELISCNIYPGEIILSKMGDPVARACIIPPIHDRYLMCSDGIRLAVDQRRFCTYFIYMMINAPAFREKAANAGTGSTRKRIGLTELRSLELKCPSLPEQTAIASIFSDMDAELTALETRLTKTRALKQAMMSELLTGKTRLPTS